MTRLLASLILGACISAAETIDLSSPDLVAEGSALYAKSCAVGYCHGSEGRSARGPALRDRVWDPHDLYRITSEGLPGTSMPGWKDLMPGTSVWAVTAYILSLSSEPPTGASARIETDASETLAAPAALSAEGRRGKALFFDLTRERRCGVCHELDGLGSAVGPNLAVSARNKSEPQLRQAILEPGAEISYGFEQVELELRGGERLAGVLAEETDSVIRVFDAASVPPPLRTVAKDDIEEQRTRARSSMPDNLGETYSSAEIASIVTFVREITHDPRGPN